jgi:hypothetical protein
MNVIKNVAGKRSVVLAFRKAFLPPDGMQLLEGILPSFGCFASPQRFNETMLVVGPMPLAQGFKPLRRFTRRKKKKGFLEAFRFFDQTPLPETRQPVRRVPALEIEKERRVFLFHDPSHISLILAILFNLTKAS